MKKAINIIWETDGQDVNLPEIVDLPIGVAEHEDEEANYESINNYLSDTFGFLVKSYDVETAENTETKSALEIQDEDIEEIARLIKLGNRRGILDREVGNGDFVRIDWDLSIKLSI